MEIPHINLTLRINTINTRIKGQYEGGLPLRHWTVSLTVLDDKRNTIYPKIFDAITFYLHPSFSNHTRIIKNYPYTLSEVGWGEFDIRMKGTFLDDIGTFILDHPLLFDNTEYYIDYEIQVPYHTKKLRNELIGFFAIEYNNTTREKLDDKKLVNLKRGLNNLKLCTEDTLTEVMDLILSHPAVQNRVEQYPRTEDFYMDVAQFSDDLLIQLYAYLEEHDIIKLDARVFKGTNKFNYL
ncbi:hypothetical protein TPHA_0F03180 [Tetrapisispora phaffii CBS 4417]|uniref:YEATS domain-containing protein n=1 Tax=Tetrapisispora phaffii (strain ATCC 24235 / CBS 4417 / NBRC 1672 / NRRL Y-8282 / UCD 70-5) TaxID=1071381 RepID=G8BUL3_TETPH|nr:hypothetical protein TPHA_0F03180 [Tetrapisispora phaffii CBS 4417]CCE63799.1 hypothetical protein TPHA_0F03180 [Tetrapisispora phaffii CBS 4417]